LEREPNDGAEDNPENDRDLDGDDLRPDFGPKDSMTSTFGATLNGAVPPIRVVSPNAAALTTPGRRNPITQSRSGRFVRAVADPEPVSLAVAATLRSASFNGIDQGNLFGKESIPEERDCDLGRIGNPSYEGLTIRPSDLHRQVRSGESGTLILFVVDASGSMAARRRMEAVKGAVLSLLVDAYQQRDRVGVIAFRGPRAELLLPPTNSLDLARDTLEQLPTGGRTPLAHALMLAAETVRRQRRSIPDLLVLAVILTDGKANVALPGADGPPWEQSVQSAALLASEDVATLVLDTDQEFVRVGRARELAEALGAEYRPLEDLTADSLALEIRQRCQPQFHALRPLGAKP
jgi:magnesium chelatase subunit D